MSGITALTRGRSHGASDLGGMEQLWRDGLQLVAALVLFAEIGRVIQAIEAIRRGSRT